MLWFTIIQSQLKEIFFLNENSDIFQFRRLLDDERAIHWNEIEIKSKVRDAPFFFCACVCVCVSDMLVPLLLMLSRPVTRKAAGVWSSRQQVTEGDSWESTSHPISLWASPKNPETFIFLPASPWFCLFVAGPLRSSIWMWEMRAGDTLGGCVFFPSAGQVIPHTMTVFWIEINQSSF